MENTLHSRRSALAALGAGLWAVACAKAVDAPTAAAAGSGAAADASAASSDAAIDANNAVVDIAVADSQVIDAAALPVDATVVADASEGALDVAAADASVDAAVWPNPIAAITSNADHYVTSCCEIPLIDPSSWTINLLDVGAPLGTIDWAFLTSLTAKNLEHTLQCISAGPDNLSISNAIWTGLPLKELMIARGIAIPSQRITLKIGAQDGYTTDLPVSDLEAPLWLMWKMNGEPIPAEHGFPARLVIPGRYGMKNCKWLTQIEFLDQPFLGQWEKTGWSDQAVYKANALILHPVLDQKLLNNQVFRIAGSAYAGADPVVAVAVRVDDGAWQQAVLDYAPGANRWVLWHLDWSAAGLGVHKVQARCTTAAGLISDDNADPMDELSGQGYGGSMSVLFKVA